MSFLGLLKSEVDDREWRYEAKDFLGFVAEGMTEREAADRARLSLDDLRKWKRIPGFRDAIRRARRNGPGITARGICSLDALLPRETDEQAAGREARERDERSGRQLDATSGVPGSGSPEYGAGRWR